VLESKLHTTTAGFGNKEKNRGKRRKEGERKGEKRLEKKGKRGNSQYYAKSDKIDKNQ
jgi:hypothetical protein